MFYDLSNLPNSVRTTSTQNRKSKNYDDDLSLDVHLYVEVSI